MTIQVKTHQFSTQTVYIVLSKQQIWVLELSRSCKRGEMLILHLVYRIASLVKMSLEPLPEALGQFSKVWEADRVLLQDETQNLKNCYSSG